MLKKYFKVLKTKVYIAIVFLLIFCFGYKTEAQTKITNQVNAEFWELSYNFQFWNNETSKLEITFKAKSNVKTKLMMRLIASSPWGFGGGDLFHWEIPLNSEVQEIHLNEHNAVKFLGNSYDLTLIPPFAWDYTNRTGFRGRMSLFGSLLDDEITQKGVEIWMDDVVIKEADLSLEKFEIEYAPSQIRVGDNSQIIISEWIYPTNAPVAIDFRIENITGEATVDAFGKINAISKGTVEVYVDTPNKTDEKRITVEIVDEILSVGQINKDIIQLNKTILDKGELLEIKGIISPKYYVYSLDGLMLMNDNSNNYINTTFLPEGVYVVLIVLENGETASRKFIIK